MADHECSSAIVNSRVWTTLRQTCSSAELRVVVNEFFGAEKKLGVCPPASAKPINDHEFRFDHRPNSPIPNWIET
jgi:hypothetical protein